MGDDAGRRGGAEEGSGDGGDFTEWAAELDEPELFSERTERSGNVVQDLLDRLRASSEKNAVRLGYTVGEPAPCIYCGETTKWRDEWKQVRCFGCPRGAEPRTPEEEADQADLLEILDRPGWHGGIPMPCSVCRRDTRAIDPTGTYRHPNCPAAGD